MLLLSVICVLNEHTIDGSYLGQKDLVGDTIRIVVSVRIAKRHYSNCCICEDRFAATERTSRVAATCTIGIVVSMAPKGKAKAKAKVAAKPKAKARIGAMRPAPGRAMRPAPERRVDDGAGLLLDGEGQDERVLPAGLAALAGVGARPVAEVQGGDQGAVMGGGPAAMQGAGLAAANAGLWPPAGHFGGGVGAMAPPPNVWHESPGSALATQSALLA
eukprot:6462244-Amphidinium_carterae.1